MKVYKFDNLSVTLSDDNTIEDWNKLKKVMDILLKISATK